MLQRNSSQSERDRLLQETDRCVKCGLCLPSCPTYQITANEAESPRGRLALMEALARGQLPAAGALNRHLDNCLLCRACESACPSGVRYGPAMDLARQLTLASHSKWLPRLANALTRPRLAAPAIAAGRLLPAALSIRGVPVGRLARSAAALAGRPPAPGEYPAAGPRRGRVGLFLGCVGRRLQGGALAAAVRLLPRLGFDVVIPAGQGCCGAMHRHLGDDRTADGHLAANRRAFAGSDIDLVVSVATGCGIHLEEHWSGAPPHRDLNAFLAAREELLTGLDFDPLTARAALHTPCTQRRMGMDTATARRFLERVPGVEVIDLPGNDRCCGAAGLHLLSHHRWAERLAAPKIDALRSRRPQWLLSANPGCTLHLADQAWSAGLELTVAHPVELLARQLRPPP